MTPQDYTPVYIISAFNPAHLTTCLTDDENARRHKNLKTILEVVAAGQYREVTGSYKGQEELAFLVTADLGKQFAIGLGIKFEQESILYLDNQRNAYLIECRDFTPVAGFPQKHIGSFRSCTEEDAREGDAWTRLHNTYYHVV